MMVWASSRFIYVESLQGFALAGESKALLPPLPQRGGLDVLSLHRYLGFLLCSCDGMSIKSLRNLQPGQVMVVRQGRSERCWNWYFLPGF